MTDFQFTLQSSRRGTSLFVGLHGLAISAVLYANLPVLLKIGFIFIVFMSSYYLCWRIIRLHGKNCITHCHKKNDYWILQNKQGQTWFAHLMPHSLITPVFCLLNFKTITPLRKTPYIQFWHRYHTLVLFQDALPKPLWRRLFLILQSSS